MARCSVVTKREYIFMYSWFTLLYRRNEHSIVKQLYSIFFFFLKKGKSCSLQDPVSVGRHEHPSLSNQTGNVTLCAVFMLILQLRMLSSLVKTIILEDFPGGPVDRNLPAKQGSQVQSLAGEDPTCHRAAKPVQHNRWAHTLRVLLCLELGNKRSHRSEKPMRHSQRGAASLHS